MYKLLSNKKRSFNEILVTYIIATMTNILSVKYENIADFLNACFDYKNFSVLLMLCAVSAVFLINVFLWPLSKFLYHKSRDAFRITKIMNANTSVCYKNVLDRGGYSWGEDKCLLVANNLFQGYSPDDIIIEDYKDNMYHIDKSLSEKFDSYTKSDQICEIKQKGNNMRRGMVASYSTNFNKQMKKVFIDLQQTDYITTSFFWKTYREMEDSEKQQIMTDLFESKVIYPNSFCLHLALLTKDDEVIVTSISKNKSNDYPYSWAVTIGEQIELADFNQGCDLNSQFVKKWVYRALYEEFGLYDNQLENMIIEDGIRVLSLNSEGDINNIALMVVAHLGCGFDEFKEEIKIHPEIDKEFSNISVVKVKDIPFVLYQYNHNKGKMHPSSFLRLLLCYLHRKGISSFVKEYLKIEKGKVQNKKMFYDL